MLKIKQGVDLVKYGFNKNKLTNLFFKVIGSSDAWLFVQVNKDNELEFFVEHDVSFPDSEDYYNGGSFNDRAFEDKLSEVSYGEVNITSEFSVLLARFIFDGVIEF